MDFKTNRIKVLAMVGVVVLAGVILFLGTWKWTYTIIIAGEKQQIYASGFTVGQLLNSAKIPVGDADVINPPFSRIVFFNHPTIEIKKAVQVLILDGKKTYSLLTTERNPTLLLHDINLFLNPNDQILMDGEAVDPTIDLTEMGSYVLQIKRAVIITLTEDQTNQTFSSTAATLGQALWQKGLRTIPEDAITPGTETLLDQAVTVSIKKAVLIDITMDGKVIQVLSAADTVGEALTDAGVALQNLDYSNPSETSPLPTDGKIQVVREREDVILQKTNIPFETQYQADPDTELDQTSLIQAGVDGVQVTRIRTLYKDGVEVSHQTDAEWQAQAPQKEIIGYGTKVVIRTTVVDGMTISYWRALRVYATSYSPCNQGYDYCTTATASGATLKKGIISVIVSWYLQMEGQQIYVPGYGTGTIADTEGGIPGTNTIDLGFSESDFVNWHDWVVIYFLTPVPENIPWLLQ